ncbi:hypothetical protein [Salinirubrum litoreum]|uniref:Uncharacterized protein n=1 Tax=Salinirubrum litoreum TaxID=1126234 RepID=A0ABD5R904_9EURY|nr:hypothetical protein [Salinirubrum litoreum]
MTRLADLCGIVFSSLRSRVARVLPNRLVLAVLLDLLVCCLLLFWMAVTVT